MLAAKGVNETETTIMTHTEEFTAGWQSATQDDFEGLASRTSFQSYHTDVFKNGYYSFWDNQNAEIADAENNCIADYDARLSA